MKAAIFASLSLLFAVAILAISFWRHNERIVSSQITSDDLRQPTSTLQFSNQNPSNYSQINPSSPLYQLIIVKDRFTILIPKTESEQISLYLTLAKNRHDAAIAVAQTSPSLALKTIKKAQGYILRANQSLEETNPTEVGEIKILWKEIYLSAQLCQQTISNLKDIGTNNEKIELDKLNQELEVVKTKALTQIQPNQDQNREQPNNSTQEPTILTPPPGTDPAELNPYL